MNRLCMCVDGLIAVFKLRSQVHTHKWSMELDSPVTWRTRIWNETRHWAWRNKLCTRIISCAHLRTIFRHPCEPALPPPVHAPHAWSPWPRMQTRNGGRQNKCFGVKSKDFSVQIRDQTEIRTKTGCQKLTT